MVAHLTEAGAKVRVLTREPTVLPPGVETKQGNLSAPDSLRGALQDVEAVFLLWPFASTDGLAAVLALIADHAEGWSTCPRQPSETTNDTPST